MLKLHMKRTMLTIKQNKDYTDNSFNQGNNIEKPRLCILGKKKKKKDNQ